MKVYIQGVWGEWYDRSYRTWYAAKFDKQGNQIGDSIFAFTKQEIKEYINLDIKGVTK